MMSLQLVNILSTCIFLFCCVSSFQLKNGWKLTRQPTTVYIRVPRQHSIFPHQFKHKLHLTSEEASVDYSTNVHKLHLTSEEASVDHTINVESPHNQSLTIETDTKSQSDVDVLLSSDICTSFPSILNADPSELENAINCLKQELPGYELRVDVNMSLTILEKFLHNKTLSLKPQRDYAFQVVPKNITTFINRNRWIFDPEKFESFAKTVEYLSTTLEWSNFITFSFLHRAAKVDDISKIHLPTVIPKILRLYNIDFFRLKRILKLNPALIFANFTELTNRVNNLRNTFPEVNITSIIGASPWIVLSHNASDIIAQKFQELKEVVQTDIRVYILLNNYPIIIETNITDLVHRAQQLLQHDLKDLRAHRFSYVLYQLGGPLLHLTHEEFVNRINTVKSMFYLAERHSRSKLESNSTNDLDGDMTTKDNRQSHPTYVFARSSFPNVTLPTNYESIEVGNLLLQHSTLFVHNFPKFQLAVSAWLRLDSPRKILTLLNGSPELLFIANPEKNSCIRNIRRLISNGKHMIKLMKELDLPYPFWFNPNNTHHYSHTTEQLTASEDTANCTAATTSVEQSSTAMTVETPIMLQDDEISASLTKDAPHYKYAKDFLAHLKTGLIVRKNFERRWIMLEHLFPRIPSPLLTYFIPRVFGESISRLYPKYSFFHECLHTVVQEYMQYVHKNDATNSTNIQAQQGRRRRRGSTQSPPSKIVDETKDFVNEIFPLMIERSHGKIIPPFFFFSLHEDLHQQRQREQKEQQQEQQEHQAVIKELTIPLSPLRKYTNSLSSVKPRKINWENFFVSPIFCFLRIIFLMKHPIYQVFFFNRWKNYGMPSTTTLTQNKDVQKDDQWKSYFFPSTAINATNATAAIDDAAADPYPPRWISDITDLLSLSTTEYYDLLSLIDVSIKKPSSSSSSSLSIFDEYKNYLKLFNSHTQEYNKQNESVWSDMLRMDADQEELNTEHRRNEERTATTAHQEEDTRPRSMNNDEEDENNEMMIVDGEGKESDTNEIREQGKECMEEEQEQEQVTVTANDSSAEVVEVDAVARPLSHCSRSTWVRDYEALELSMNKCIPEKLQTVFGLFTSMVSEWKRERSIRNVAASYLQGLFEQLDIVHATLYPDSSVQKQ